MTQTPQLYETAMNESKQLQETITQILLYDNNKKNLTEMLQHFYNIQAAVNLIVDEHLANQTISEKLLNEMENHGKNKIANIIYNNI